MGRRTIVPGARGRDRRRLGAVLLSGSGQPVTARSYAALAGAARAALDRAHPRTRRRPCATGCWCSGGLTRAALPSATARRTTCGPGAGAACGTPVALSDRDTAGRGRRVVVVRHAPRGRAATWWRYDVRQSALVADAEPVSRAVSVPSRSARRCTPSPATWSRSTASSSAAGPRSPPTRVSPRSAHGRRSTASRARHGRHRAPGGHPHRLCRRPVGRPALATEPGHPAAPVTAAPDGSTRVSVGGRTLVVRGDARLDPSAVTGTEPFVIPVDVQGAERSGGEMTVRSTTTSTRAVATPGAHGVRRLR